MENQSIYKAAHKSPKDKRDYTYVGMASTPFDWDKGYDVEKEIGKKLTIKDQNGSGSCGGQAWSYFGQVLDPEHVEKSAKFIYAQDFVLPAGTYGRDNCIIVKEKGWGDESLTRSYMGEKFNIPPTEQFMQRKEDITIEAFKQALTDKALSYVHVPIDIESIAQKIRDNKGVILGICGKNNGTWSGKFPKPPVGSDVWRHWIYCGKALTIDGKKYIGFCNSWGINTGEQGWQYISEEYLSSKYIFETWTLDYNYQKYQFTKMLKYGDKNGDVKELQKRLQVVPVSGWFGPITLRAVKKYQRDHKIVPTGVVGPNTRKALNS